MMGNVNDHDTRQSSHRKKITEMTRSADNDGLGFVFVIPRSGGNNPGTSRLSVLSPVFQTADLSGSLASCESKSGDIPVPEFCSAGCEQLASVGQDHIMLPTWPRLSAVIGSPRALLRKGVA